MKDDSKKEFLRDHPGVSKADHQYNEGLWQKHKAHEEYMRQQKIENDRFREQMLQSNGNGAGIKVETKILEDILYRLQELLCQNRSLSESITARLNSFYDSSEESLVNNWETPNINNYNGFVPKMEHLCIMLSANNDMLIRVEEKLRRLI